MYENLGKICRMCLHEDYPLLPLTTRVNSIKISSMIEEAISIVMILDEKKYPIQICKNCVNKINFIYHNRKIFIENDVKLRDIVNNSGEKIQSTKFNEVYFKVEDNIEDVSNFEDSKKIEHVHGGDFIVEYLEDHQLSDKFEYLDEEIEDKVPTTLVDNDNDSESEPIIKYKNTATPTPTKSRKKREIKKKKKMPAHPISEMSKTDPNLPRRNDHKCYICNEICDNACGLADHLSCHLEKIPYTCSVCVMEKVEIKTLAGLNLHLKMHEQPFKCNYCDKKYNSIRARDGHENTSHLTTDTGPKKCNVCDKMCPSQRSFKEHLKVHSNDYQCKTCFKSFITKSVLKRHEILHTGEKPYECSLCGHKFNHVSNYKTHLKRHNGEKAHECQFCPAKFVVSAYLKSHIKVHHSGNNYVPKRDMTDTYTSRIDEETQKRVYECNTCNKVFRGNGHILSHVRIHNKTYQCSYCGNKFPDAPALADHENVHTGAKPHACLTCGKRFAHKTNLYQHHKIHTGVKDHKCEICNKTFTYRENWKVHTRIHHSRNKPFECIICEQKFVDSLSFKKHKERHTKIPVESITGHASQTK